MSEQVCLINPPFGAIERPTVGLGLLKASACKARVPCRVLYANLAFAERIGLDLYFWFANTGEYIDLFGEWVFAGVLFPENHEASEGYIRRFVAGGYTESTFKAVLPGRDLMETLQEARRWAEEFVEAFALAVVETRPCVVGCTSSFQQNCAALALLKRIRELDPAVVTLLGGANCEGPMGRALRRAFPWVDFVVSGEAESIFPDLLQQILDRGRTLDENLLPECVIGSARAAALEQSEKARAVVWDLDTTEPPDYDDYFDQLTRSPLVHSIRPGLLLEASRGCWWGQRHRCRFCGLNGAGLTYRSKSVGRILREIDDLCTRYGTPRVEFVDNNLEPGLVDEVFPRLADRKDGISLFFETRVMARRQIESMARGGVRWLQVGIESFHPRLLSLMNKGTTVLQNIEILRWAYELGIRVSYNLLYGFPGEEDEWYVEMSRLLPLLAHLEPPRNLVPLRYDRFSVYHENPEPFGLRLAPREAYRFVYALPADLIDDMAYFFEDVGTKRPGGERPGLEAVKQEWLRWRKAFWTSEPGRERAVLHVLPCSGRQESVLYDTRPCAVETGTILTALESLVLRFCDRARRLPEIETRCMRGGANRRADVSRALGGLVERKVLVHQNGKFLSLAVTPPRQVMLQTRDFPGGFYYPEKRATPAGKTGASPDE
ncbi:MAG: RiPP maturation radical SAM C-methyltransferase [Deltaproteobacteria bacterium]|nr:RiPP maturation radical SAM C-methyltransferase [Deltaproteobacteria bacterium]